MKQRCELPECRDNVLLNTLQTVCLEAGVFRSVLPDLDLELPYSPSANVLLDGSPERVLVSQSAGASPAFPNERPLRR